MSIRITICRYLAGPFTSLLAIIWFCQTLYAIEPTITSDRVSVISEQSDVIELNFKLGEMSQDRLSIEGLDIDLFEIDGEPLCAVGNQPLTPKLTRLILIPPQSGVDVRIENLVSSTQDNIRLMDGDAAKIHFPEIGRGGSATLNRDDNNLNLPTDAQGFFPARIAELGKPAIIRGYRVIPLTINPVRWNAESGVAQIVGSVDIQLDFTTDKNRTNLVERPPVNKMSRSTLAMIESMVLNPPSVRRDDLTAGAIAYVVDEDWDDVIENLEPLIEWRRRMGWTVELLALNRTNDRSDVKEALQEAYDEWAIPPEYIVLVGDAPHRAGNTHIIAYWDHDDGANWPYESDHDYVELEGDDILPDAAIGRLMLDSADEEFVLRHVNKIVQYESEPYLGGGNDAGWQRRAAVAATDPRSGLSTKDICRWIKYLLQENNYNQVEELYFEDDGQEVDPTNFIEDNFEDGIGIFLYRGWTRMNGYSASLVNQLRHPGMYPFVALTTCNTGDYGETLYDNYASWAERFAYDENGGAIGAIGTGGASHCAYNNLLGTTVVGAPFIHDIYHTGWMLMGGKIALWRHYAAYDDIAHEENNNTESWWTSYYIYNLHGDPAVGLFTDVPELIEVEHDEEILAGSSRFEVTVQSEAGDPVFDAQVCLYKPEEFQIVEFTDTDGSVTFAMDPELTQDGEIMLTVTGRNLYPYLHDFEVSEPDYMLGIGEVSFNDEADGDGDGVANPTESIEITTEIVNYGQDVPEGEIIVTLSTGHPYLEINEDQIQLDAAPAVGEREEVSFRITLGAAFEHETEAGFDLEITNGNQVWLNSFSIPVYGADLEVSGVEYEELELEPGGIEEIYIDVQNLGVKPAPQVTGTLHSLHDFITVSINESSFDALEPDEETRSDNWFRLHAAYTFVSGNMAEFMLTLMGEDGFADTLYFDMQIGEVRSGDPVGPDEYGYLCFDDTDTTWFNCPEYAWIEINPDLGGEGTDTELRDRDEEDDESIVVDLPFEFTFYGKVYNQATICTNGWLAFGDQGEMISFRNRHLPGGECLPAMLCPFWDELKTIQSSGIYYWYDAVEHIYVVEWYDMRKLTHIDDDPTQTFQIILYDPDYHPTFNGDGIIDFMYQRIEDSDDCERVWDVPYASVGIVSPDRKMGIEYCYWNEYPASAAELENGRALRFTTLLSAGSGNIYGNVYNAEDNEPIEGVLVHSEYGTNALTDAEGNYIISNMLADELFQHSITVSKVGWNDSTISEIELLPGDTIEINFGMLYPVFGIDEEFAGIDTELETEVERTTSVYLENSGTGPLNYSGRIKLSEDIDWHDDLWSEVHNFELTDAILEVEGEDTLFLGNRRINGIVFTDTLFIVTGANREEDINHQFYRFNRAGVFIDSLPQPDFGNRHGIFGMGYDGEHIIGGLRSTGLNRSYIYFFDANLELVDSMQTPLEDVTSIAIDRGREHIYVCDFDSDIAILDYEGNVVEYGLPRWNEQLLRKDGIAWYPNQVEGDYLMIISRFNDYYRLFSWYPETDETELLHTYQELDVYSFKGIDITKDWNSSLWSLTGVQNSNSGDRASVLVLDAYTEWLTFEPTVGTLDAGENTMIDITINTQDMTIDHYDLLLRYDHNALPGYWETPISVMILDEGSIHDEIGIPFTFELESNFPNPFNSSTSISYTLPTEQSVSLTVYDIEGRVVERLFDSYQGKGWHSVTFNAQNLPSGLYFVRLQSDQDVAVRKIMLIR